MNASFDCTIDHANVVAHSWRANLYNVSKYRKVANPNKDDFSAIGPLKSRNSKI